MHLPSPGDVYQAHERIRQHVVRTPLVYAETISRHTGSRVYLKLETLQRTGAFKFRGAFNFISASAGASRGIVAASSGNHALGIALACQLQGLEAMVVMPTNAPPVKRDRARAYGARVILEGAVYDEARAHGETLAQEKGWLFAPSFDHPLIIAGQGTIGCELCEQLPAAEAVVVPVGGGGLMAGLLLVSPPGCQVIGVQAQGAASMALSLQAGRLTGLERVDTIADGIATLKPGRLNYRLAQARGAKVVLVSDQEILDAMSLLLEEGVVAEPAAAAPLAALLAGRLELKGKLAVLVITGRNLSRQLLAQVAQTGTEPSTVPP